MSEPKTEPSKSDCQEQHHLAYTENIYDTKTISGKYCVFYACARCGVVFSPDAILRLAPPSDGE